MKIGVEMVKKSKLELLKTQARNIDNGVGG